MAHDIEFVNGVAQMVYAGEECWHGLGTKISDDLTPIQMLETAGLDWTVEKIPAYAEVAGQKVSVGKSALVRSFDNKILDVVSDDWNPVQNEEAFEFFNDFIAAGGIKMHTAGSLNGGKIVWCQAKLDESFDIFNGDVTESYLLFTNYHKYGFSTDVRVNMERVVCQNTLAMALGEKVERFAKISHRKEFNGDNVKMTIGVASEKLAKFKEAAEFLGARRYTVEQMVSYFKTVFPVTGSGEKEMSRNAKIAIETVHTQPGANYAEGSFWQLLNSVTNLTDNLAGRTEDTRKTSAWYGPNKQLKLNALNLALEMAA